MWIEKKSFTRDEVYAYTTPLYPFAIHIPGPETSVLLAVTVVALCSGEEMMVWDAQSWGEPLAVFFQKRADFELIRSILESARVKYSAIGVVETSV